MIANESNTQPSLRTILIVVGIGGFLAIAAIVCVGSIGYILVIRAGHQAKQDFDDAIATIDASEASVQISPNTCAELEKAVIVNDVQVTIHEPVWPAEFVIRYSIVNISQTNIKHFDCWALPQTSNRRKTFVELFDEHGNSYKVLDHSGYTAWYRNGHKELRPGDRVSKDEILFSEPVDAAKKLTLRLPKENIGAGNGYIICEFPPPKKAPVAQPVGNYPGSPPLRKRN